MNRREASRAAGDARIAVSADVASDATIGSGTWIEAGAVIEADVSVGAGCRIERGAFIAAGSVLEDEVRVGPGAILTNERYPRAVGLPGSAAGPATLDPVALDHGCTVGAGAIVVAGRRVGRHATVGAGAVVTRDVTAHALVVGNPARRIGWVCACGSRLLDALAHPAPAQPERYATDPTLTCSGCDRRYDYVPDEDGLADHAATLPQGRPA